MYNTYLADPAKNVLQRPKKRSRKGRTTLSLWEPHWRIFPLWLDTGETPRLSPSCPVPANALQGLWGILHCISHHVLCTLTESDLSFSIWEMDAITRHTTHEKSWVKWMFLNETYYSNTAVILMKHLGVESLRGWQFTAWNKIRRKKNKQNSQVLFCVSCGKVFGFEHL